MSETENVTNVTPYKKEVAALDEFLAAFYPDEAEMIHFRAFKPSGAPDLIFNRPQLLTLTRSQLRRTGHSPLLGLNKHHGIYFCPNAGGARDKDIVRFNAAFVEDDSISVQEQHDLLDLAPLPPSIRVETRKSVHAYWLLSENCSPEDWKRLQQQLIYFFDGDPSIKNPSRVMRVPGFMHLSCDGSIAGKYEAHVVKVTHFFPENRFTLAEIRDAFPGKDLRKTTGSQPDLNQNLIIGNGHRNTTLFSIASSLTGRGLLENEVMAALTEVNTSRVVPPLPSSEIETIVKNAIRYSAGTVPAIDVGVSDPQLHLAPPVLQEAALYGLAGDVVRAIEQHTEADNAALLVQFLAAFGCLIGKSAYFRVEADKHFTKLFVVIFGASSKGRKGTSWGHIKRLLCRVDPSFENCIQDGLSSGEGLIFHLRDKTTKQSAIKKDGRIEGYQDEIVDQGASDKRAFVLEPEFARVLRTMQREGNTLSSVVRQSWDSDRLRVMTKSALHATETHISIVGHITSHELKRNLDETEMANGFANRFLWVSARRSKVLPFGGDLQESDLNELVGRLHTACRKARETNQLTMDNKARARWVDVYGHLSEGRPGLIGSVTSRAEAQVMRLASLYALLDCSSLISDRHLDAALSLWSYCEASAEYIFGTRTGDKTADKIYAAISGSDTGLSKTNLRDLFKRNVSAAEIDRALSVLLELGRIWIRKEETGGRPSEFFVSVNGSYDKSD
jgi:hypothetical protein